MSYFFNSYTVEKKAVMKEQVDESIETAISNMLDMLKTIKPSEKIYMKVSITTKDEDTVSVDIEEQD